MKKKTTRSNGKFIEQTKFLNIIFDFVSYIYLDHLIFF